MATPTSTPFALTGDSLIDAATHGYYWLLGADRTVRWSLSNGFSGEYWISPTETVSLLNQIFSTFSYYADIRFQYSGYYASPTSAAWSSDINISGDNAFNIFSGYSTLAIGLFPGAPYASVYPGSAGDIFLNLASDVSYLRSYAPGSQGYFLFVHEIGHTLGLKHPHDSGGTGRPTLSALDADALDRDWFTVMSYNDDLQWNQFGWDPATPMLMDVLALQYLYGRNMQTNAGNTVHSLPEYGLYATIWDAGGIDTVDVSASSQGWNIALPDTQLSHLIDTKAGLAMLSAEASATSPTTFYWLTGDIENASGSSFADTISGSALDNQFFGNGGNDVLVGKDGNDTFWYLSGRDAIYGGSGTDTLNVGLTASDCTLTRLRTNSFILRDKSGNSALCRDVEKLVFTSSEFMPATMTAYGNVDLELVQIYVAAFRRTPELSGYKYWLQQKTEQGLAAVANTIFSLDVVKAIYPSNSTNAQFVTAIYQNVFNKAPDTDGLLYWSAQLATRSRGQLVIDMTNVALAVPDGTAGKDYFQNRVDWALYTADYQTRSNKEFSPTYLSSLTNSVTDDTSAMISLIGQAQSGLIF